jgi:hypothetical protein
MTSHTPNTHIHDLSLSWYTHTWPLTLLIHTYMTSHSPDTHIHDLSLSWYTHTWPLILLIHTYMTSHSPGLVYSLQQKMAGLNLFYGPNTHTILLVGISSCWKVKIYILNTKLLIFVDKKFALWVQKWEQSQIYFQKWKERIIVWFVEKNPVLMNVVFFYQL